MAITDSRQRLIYKRRQEKIGGDYKAFKLDEEGCPQQHRNPGMTVTEVKDLKTEGHVNSTEAEYDIAFIPKVKIEVVVS